MRILIDIGHPADVHFFRNFYSDMIRRKHEVFFTARNKDVTYQLLDAYGLSYIPYGKHYTSKIGKLVGIFKIDYQLYKIVKKIKPDLFFCHGSFYSSHVAFFMRKPFLTFEDTGNLEQILLYKFFSGVILTPDSFVRDLGKKQIRFNGTKELAYLHPNTFTPNDSVLEELCIKPDERFVLLRFVGWSASHDFGHKGISHSNKLRIIEEISKITKVFISSESVLPEEIAHLQLKLPPEKILDVMYYADLLYGEGATMVSECAILGTPAILVNNAFISYTQEQEIKYDLVYNFTESEKDQENSIQKALELLRLPDLKVKWHEKRDKMIKEKIDLTAFMVWFVENWPESRKIMKETPEYQERFR